VAAAASPIAANVSAQGVALAAMESAALRFKNSRREALSGEMFLK
jgi:hypothetical protein